MKVKKLDKKLKLNKTTVADLHSTAMEGIRGGIDLSEWCTRNLSCFLRSEHPDMCYTDDFRVCAQVTADNDICI
ncbi:MAG: hypothetical protein GY765_38740 [bacterium]|nr:hypothetical protein [bacterium]